MMHYQNNSCKFWVNYYRVDPLTLLIITVTSDIFRNGFLKTIPLSSIEYINSTTGRITYTRTSGAPYGFIACVYAEEGATG